ncbi:heme peroxidase family protein [Parafrankia sp. EUN1f]|uniref:peroxidase family protein n=1 Tax=Parafrankia sp. EUN1f TaxID=102897 RepID=UPI0001C43970|nr:heme peroxidase family protein [Parafrankia sp. EUN1f]EFC85919.1 conserved hypothetical protein [Parafrankia sp. EUN1f]
MTPSAADHRILRAVHHARQIPPDDASGDTGGAGGTGGDSATPGQLELATSTPFDFLFAGLAANFPDHHLQGDPAVVRAALERLGNALTEPSTAADGGQAVAGTSPVAGAQVDGPAGNSTIPPVYTYWGQFTDHDLTLNTGANSTLIGVANGPVTPLLPTAVANSLRNGRQPALDLDSVYGGGPVFDDAGAATATATETETPDDLYDGVRLRLGRVAEANNDGSRPAGDPIPLAADGLHDLPRDGSVALVGDGRNDENLIVAQFHVAFLRFHNAVVDWVLAHEPYLATDREVFNRARDLVRWHYQWLVVHDYLKTVALPGVTDKVLLSGPQHFAPRAGKVFMPLEFSAAAFRFGHSMVRAAYDYNQNFGRAGGGKGKVLDNAPFSLLFSFTGGANPPFVGRTSVLPFNWVIEWDRFVDKGSPKPDHFARKIDTRLAPPLFDLINEIGPAQGVVPADAEILKRLAVRNLLRGYQLALPTGQAVAGALGVTPLTADELLQGNSDEVSAALTDGGFLQATPLWYYILKEAEVRANGNSLGEVGSRIVVETLIGQLRLDPGSYLNQDNGWSPEQGVLLPNGDPIVTIKDLFVFAGVLTGP